MIAAQELLDRNGIVYTTENVPQENYFLTIVLPIILTAVVLVGMFMLMNARAGAGSANAKMMNFRTQTGPIWPRIPIRLILER